VRLIGGRTFRLSLSVVKLRHTPNTGAYIASFPRSPAPFSISWPHIWPLNRPLLRAVQRSRMRSRERSGRRPGNLYVRCCNTGT